MPTPIALWSTPRRASGAFDRMVREPGDHRVFTEPFSAAYYDGPERVSHQGLQDVQAVAERAWRARCGRAAPCPT